MPVSTATLRRIAFIVVVALASGIAWLASWQVAQAVLGFTRTEDGIMLVYVPAGIRLMILLIGGLWGALGIALAFPVVLLQVYPNATWAETFIYSAIAGLVPWAAVYGTCRVAGITREFGRLRAIHLPLLAFAVSLAAGLANTAALTWFGRIQADRFLQYTAGMTVGDFLGCFAVILLVRLFVIGRGKRD